MDCVITAGGLPKPDDPLYAYTEGKTKALLDMGGRTMLERVVDALQDANYVDDIVVVGLGGDLGMTFKRPVFHLADQGSLIGNVIGGIRFLKERKPELGMVIISSSDIPTITADIVDQFVSSCEPFDKAIYYNFVDERTMEARFPGSNRTFVKLKGVSVAGGDLLLAHSDLAESHHDLWTALTEARKHAWKLASLVGIRFLLKFVFRQVSLADIDEKVLQAVGRPAKSMLTSYAELAMDADKPHQVDLLRQEFS